MPEIYNLSGIINSGDPGTLAQGTISILNGYWYGYFILFVVGIVTFMYLKKSGYWTRSCFVGTTWMLMISAIFLRAMLLLDNWVFWMMVLSVPVCIFITALMDES